MKRDWLACAFFLTCVSSLWGSPTVEEIVRRSVQNTNVDWAAAPQYSFTERDIVTKHGKRSMKTYRVVMIDGSPYNQLIAADGRQLSPQQAKNEERKLKREIQHRHHQTTGERQRRIAAYQRERRQDHALMSEMVKAFDFTLRGEEAVAGHRCFVLSATPKPRYQPISRDTKVLKGMRGEMWIDAEQYQWMKVRAEVFRPVAFGLFIADVQPGTEFTLEQKPVENNIWLPSHFSTQIKATVLFFSNRSTDDETYFGYQHVANVERAGGIN